MKFQCCFYILSVAVYLLLGCSPSRFIGKEAKARIIKNKNLQTAHIGISIYDTEVGKYLYNYQGDKYFVPASNVKLAACYAAMKYLGDSLAGLRYQVFEEVKAWPTVFKNGSVMLLQATGDPTFMHPDFSQQPVFSFLKNTNISTSLDLSNWQDERWGNGWAWNDYNDSYMAERSPMPIYGNVVLFRGNLNNLQVSPSFFSSSVIRDSTSDWNLYPASIERNFNENKFYIKTGNQNRILETPFLTDDGEIIYTLLSDTLHKTILSDWNLTNTEYTKTVRSQPTDSVLRPMMHRSDNFFAEQSLLMVSNERLGLMNDEKIIDTLLETDLAGLPQRPHWVDGSGLSRYNLFTPQDFVTILNKMKTEFGVERLKNILPTGGQGTLSNYFKADSGFLWAKTGTLSGVVALSGFMYTRRGKLLLFSVQVNNHVTSGTNVRRAAESFIRKIRHRL